MTCFSQFHDILVLQANIPHYDFYNGRRGSVVTVINQRTECLEITSDILEQVSVVVLLETRRDNSSGRDPVIPVKPRTHKYYPCSPFNWQLTPFFGSKTVGGWRPRWRLWRKKKNSSHPPNTHTHVHTDTDAKIPLQIPDGVFGICFLFFFHDKKDNSQGTRILHTWVRSHTTAVAFTERQVSSETWQRKLYKQTDDCSLRNKKSRKDKQKKVHQTVKMRDSGWGHNW